MNLRVVMLMMLAVLGIVQMHAADYTCWTQAVYKMAVKGTSEANYECGLIYVSTELLTDESQIEAVAEEINTDPLYHYGPAANCKQDYYYYVKANPGYKFIGWGTAQPSSATWKPSSSSYAPNVANMVGDYYWYKSATSAPYSSNTEEKPAKLNRYAVFEKVEQMEEPTGETVVAFGEPTGMLELVEGSVTKNFSVDLALSEELDYDMPGSDKNAKPVENLKQFVTVTGVNGNKSEVANYSLVYTAHDLGFEKGTEYSCSTIRLFFPYGIKADTYTVHLPFGLYTTKAGNKTPAYEFQIKVTEDTNTSLTVKSVFPSEDMTIKYKAETQTSTPDPEKGEFERSNVTVTVTFNEVVQGIDESKKAGVKLVNATEGVNYRFENVFLPAVLTGRVSGEGAISFPELVNGNYILTIPAGLFKGTAKANEEITVNFTVSGFSTKLKPYEMVTDVISPKSGDMMQKVEKLSEIAISYKGEHGNAQVLVGDASGIKVQRYTEVIQGEGESAQPVRTYYDVATTTSAKVQDGRLIVSFTPALATGLYEVSIPAGLAANMEPGNMTMAQKVNAGYALTPAHANLTFNVETTNLEEKSFAVSVKAENRYGTLIVPFNATLPEGLKAYTVTGLEADGATLVMEEVSRISANTAYIIENTTEADLDEPLKYSEEEVPAETTTGLLTGVYTKTAAKVGTYVLQNNGGVVGFYMVADEGLWLGANRCYLSVPASEAKAFFFGQATAIEALHALAGGKAEIYDLNGRKLQGLQKGVNIVNGKKVMVK